MSAFEKQLDLMMKNLGDISTDSLEGLVPLRKARDREEAEKAKYDEDTDNTIIERAMNKLSEDKKESVHRVLVRLENWKPFKDGIAAKTLLESCRKINATRIDNLTKIVKKLIPIRPKREDYIK